MYYDSYKTYGDLDGLDLQSAWERRKTYAQIWQDIPVRSKFLETKK
jgi:hypothetical protein